MSGGIAALHAWRREAAVRLQMASTTLGILLNEGAFSETYAERARFGAGQLLGLGRALHTDAVEPWPVVTTRDIEHRLLVALRELRIVARWHGVTSELALTRLARILDDLEKLLLEARGGEMVAARAILGDNAGRTVTP